MATVLDPLEPHTLGIGYLDHGRNCAETLVESMTFIVASSIALDTAGETVPYVADWNDSNLDDLRRFAQLVDETARRIEHALHTEVA